MVSVRFHHLQMGPSSNEHKGIFGGRRIRWSDKRMQENQRGDQTGRLNLGFKEKSLSPAACTQVHPATQPLNGVADKVAQTGVGVRANERTDLGVDGPGTDPTSSTSYVA